MMTSSRRIAPARTKVLFFVAHLLLVALSIRPLHAHALHTSASTPQLTSDSTSFCPECTFGGDQMELTGSLEAVAANIIDDVSPIATIAVVDAAAVPAPSRAPPQR